MIKLTQAGDTLVEVTIAMAIFGLVLASSFLLGMTAIRVGESAKERSQAAQIAQEQAEALRSFRDETAWGQFVGNPILIAGNATAFNMTADSGSWLPDNSAQPYTATINGQPSIYKVAITTTAPVTSSSCEVDFNITVTWPGAGSQPPNQINFVDALTDPTATPGGCT